MIFWTTINKMQAFKRIIVVLNKLATGLSLAMALSSSPVVAHAATAEFYDLLRCGNAVAAVSKSDDNMREAVRYIASALNVLDRTADGEHKSVMKSATPLDFMLIPGAVIAVCRVSPSITISQSVEIVWRQMSK